MKFKSWEDIESKWKWIFCISLPLLYYDRSLSYTVIPTGTTIKKQGGMFRKNQTKPNKKKLEQTCKKSIPDWKKCHSMTCGKMIKYKQDIIYTGTQKRVCNIVPDKRIWTQGSWILVALLSILRNGIHITVVCILLPSVKWLKGVLFLK